MGIVIRQSVAFYLFYEDLVMMTSSGRCLHRIPPPPTQLSFGFKPNTHHILCQQNSTKRAEWCGQALFRSYGCFFAEFLGEPSLVRLRLLDEITCVGLRYGSLYIMLRDFSWKEAPRYYLERTPASTLNWECY